MGYRLRGYEPSTKLAEISPALSAVRILSIGGDACFPLPISMAISGKTPPAITKPIIAKICMVIILLLIIVIVE